MNNKIIIVGSTGTLGSKLLNYTSKNSIPVHYVACYKNEKKITRQKKIHNIKKSFVLSRLRRCKMDR